MYLNNIKNYIENDLSNYNSVDQRNLTNQKRDIFMKVSFIVFMLLLFGKVCHLLLLRCESH